MTSKEYFMQILTLDEKLNEKIDERNAVLQTSVGAVRWESNKSFSNQIYSTTENRAIKLIELTEEINELVDELVDLKIKVGDEVDQLEKFPHRMVLRGRYICNTPIKKLAEQYGYTKSYMHWLHNTALKEFNEVFPDIFD